jgi:hypothetical protein
MKTAKTSNKPMALWITYADGSLRVRYFNKRDVLKAWSITAGKLKALGIVSLFTVFPVADRPSECAWTRR